MYACMFAVVTTITNARILGQTSEGSGIRHVGRCTNRMVHPLPESTTGEKTSTKSARGVLLVKSILLYMHHSMYICIYHKDFPKLPGAHRASRKLMKSRTTLPLYLASDVWTGGVIWNRFLVWILLEWLSSPKTTKQSPTSVAGRRLCTLKVYKAAKRHTFGTWTPHTLRSECGRDPHINSDHQSPLQWISRDNSMQQTQQYPQYGWQNSFHPREIRW